MQKWQDMETTASVWDVSCQSKEAKRALSLLDRTTKHIRERSLSDLLCADDNPDLPKTYYSAYQQFLSMEKRVENDFDLKNAYQPTMGKDLECTSIRELDQDKIANTENDTQWSYLITQ